MKPQGIGPVARRLLLVGGMAGCVSCVIPPPGDFAEGDAGPSSPPVFVSAAPAEFAFPGGTLFTLDRNDQRRLALTLRDVDVDDTLYVRLYVDYGLPSQDAAKGDCQAVPSSEQIRVADCSVFSLCNLVSDTEPHVLEGMVADLEFLSDSDPQGVGTPFRKLPPTAAYSFRSWIFYCNP